MAVCVTSRWVSSFVKPRCVWMLGDFATPLFVYVSAYSVTLALGVLCTKSSHAQSRGALVLGLALFVFSLGFPPSPLFVVKLLLGGVCASVWGAQFAVCLGVVLLAVWARFARLGVSVLGASRTIEPRTPRGINARTLSPILVLASLAILACTPLGLSLFCLM